MTGFLAHFWENSAKCPSLNNHSLFGICSFKWKLCSKKKGGASELTTQSHRSCVAISTTLRFAVPGLRVQKLVNRVLKGSAFKAWGSVNSHIFVLVYQKIGLMWASFPWPYCECVARKTRYLTAGTVGATALICIRGPTVLPTITFQIISANVNWVKK